MHPFLVVPLVACVLLAALALSVWLRDPGDRRHRPLIGVALAGAWWAGCELLWNLQTDAESALWFQRVGAIGWIGLGALGLHVMVNVSETEPRRWRPLLLALYAQAALATVLAWTTPLFLSRCVRTWYGWSPAPTPAALVQCAIISAGASAGLWLWRERIHTAVTSDRERRNGWILVALLTPLVAAPLTEIILPALGFFALPRLGTASLAIAGVVHVIGVYRDGESVLVPEGFNARVFEAIPDGVAAVGLDGSVRAANERIASLLGESRASLCGRSLAPHISVPLFDPPREVSDLECDLLPASGAPIPVAVTTEVQADKNGVARGVALVVRDMRQVVALRSRLIVSGRMAAVGELAAGIAHEINNPITYVRANLHVLRESWQQIAKALEGDGALATLVSEGEELIEESLEGIDRASAIVRDVRDFSHMGSDTKQPADINRLIEQTLRVARPQIPKGACVDLDLADLPSVVCDAQRMKQVFVNLVLNAAQAIGERGRLRIASSCDGESVCVSFQDDGPGIDPAAMERIFDPFFTTKPVGDGTGLGLAISFGIVEQHGGNVQVESEPGAGATFRVRLPVGER